MFPIVSKRPLNEAGTVLEYVIKAPLVAKKCLPGQFIVLRLDEHGERVPLTIADYDREAGTVTIMVQPVGQTTRMLELMEPGDCLADFVGRWILVFTHYLLPVARSLPDWLQKALYFSGQF